MGLSKKFDRVNAAIAAGVWLVSLAVYVKTQAPTLSFWDCGEFIACSYIFGIPHPPGTPTFLLFGRLAALIPTFTDISARVNLLSGLCSSLAAMFSYLLGVRIVRRWFSANGSTYSRLLTYAGPAAGALFLAFGKTQWDNSIETEVYGMAMLIMFAIAWLTMVYFENRDTATGTRVLLLAVYLAFLGIGVHMTTVLVLPLSIVVFVLKKDTPLKYWFLVATYFCVELYLIFALSTNPGEIPFYLPVTITGIFFIFFMLSFERVPWQMLVTGAGFVVTSIPAVIALVGGKTGVWTTVAVIAFLALLAFGVYLTVDYVRRRRSGAASGVGLLTTALFVLVSGVLTGITKLGLTNGLQGYHTFLLISVVLAVGIGVFIWRYIDLPLLLALAGPAMIVIGVKEFFWGTVAALCAVLLLGLIGRVAGWRTALLVILMTVVGYSTHLLPPIRSSLGPYINENNPSSGLTATIDFYERKQYGSQSMTERMFQRRGEWENQFGEYARMGFWGFFENQYAFPGRTFIITVMLGLLGAWEACRRRPEMGLYLALILLVSSVGLILYMNFADGTRQTAYDAWLEVRDRDYFFTPAFMFFGLFIGLGITAAIQLVRDLTKAFSSLPRRVILVAMPVLFLLPVQTLAGNYYYCDRSRDYVPYDYAWNILQSAEPNAVLLTFGDNDTFPLWCLQEVYGVRKDVKSVCCALANGTWYIKQIRDYMGLELGWTDAQIDDLRPFRTKDGKIFRLQDQVTDAIIQHNASRRPINFTLLANPSSRRYFGNQIDSIIELRGLVYSLVGKPTTGGYRVPIEENTDLMIRSGRLKYRGWTDPSIYRSESTDRSIAGVADRFAAVTEALVQEKRYTEAAAVAEFVNDSVYHTDRSIETLISLMAEAGDTAEVAAALVQYPPVDAKSGTLVMARAYAKSGEVTTAKTLLSGLLEQYPDYRDALDELMKIYITERNIEAMVNTLRTWAKYNPGDRNVAQALAELEEQLQKSDARRTDSP
jgi:hypothetical protein